MSVRTPEWRAHIEAALTDPRAIDKAMQWAYDLGLQAQRDYAALLGVDLARIEETTYIEWVHENENE